MATNVIDPILVTSLLKAIAATAAYSDDNSLIVDLRGVKEKAVLVKNDGANPLDWKILGSLDDGASYDVDVKAEAAVAGGAKELHRSSEYCTHWKIQVKSALGTNATVKLAGIGA